MGTCTGSKKQTEIINERTEKNLRLSSDTNIFLYNEERELIGQQIEKLRLEEMVGFHKWIGALTFKNQTGAGAGSAVLISKNLILTVSHNIYNKSQGIRHTDFKFYLGPCGIVSEYYEIDPNSCRYPIQFETCEGEEKCMYEYAIMKLKKDYDGPQTDFPPLSTGCRKCVSQLKTLKLSIYGYPTAKNYSFCRQDQKSVELCQYGLTKQVEVKINPIGSMTYNISTQSGQSGCPIFQNSLIFGLHLGAHTKQQQLNYGKVFTEEILEDLQNWAKELEGDTFRVNPREPCDHSSLPQEDFFINKEDKLIKNNGSLKAVCLRKHPYLKEVSLCQNYLTSVDPRYNYFLTNIFLSGNQINKINLSKNINLVILGLSDNRLKTISLKKCRELIQLYLSKNCLTEIDLSENQKLVIAALNDNYLKKVIVWYCPKLYLELQNQESEQCEIILLYRKEETQSCRKYGEAKTKEFKINDLKFNRHKCKYKITLMEA